ncbi:hypothetical protein ACA910_005857 [Epithemia clementina (nom. ined.)]
MVSRAWLLIIGLLAEPLVYGGEMEVLTRLDTKSAVVQEMVDNKRQQSPYYTAFDDASWAISSPNMSNMFPSQKSNYERFITECYHGNPGCQYDEEARTFQNSHQPSSMKNYTKMGFQKIRAPDPLFDLMQEFWEANKEKAKIEHDERTPYHNSWQVPTTILSTYDDGLIGGGSNLSAAIWNAARDILEGWTGQKLAGSSVYGIRVYHNQSVLTPHVDRLPLVASAIINVAQDVEEDWSLEVYGHDGKATNVTMKPGDMVLYESHSVIHGRPFPLNGKFYANIFVHFEPMGDPNSTELLPKEGSLPPYIVPGSEWEEHFFKDFPNGWTLLSDIEKLARVGDLYTMRYIAQREPGRITHAKRRCTIMTAATENKHIDVLDFLIHEMGYDINMVCRSRTPLDFAKRWLSKNDAVIAFLVENGAREIHEMLTVPQNEMIYHKRCDMVETAIEFEREDVIEFLFYEMDFDINMICFGRLTPLDILFKLYEMEDSGEHPDRESDRTFAFLVDHGALRGKDIDASELDASNSTAIQADSQCELIEAAIPFESTDLLDFLFGEMDMSVNFVCESMTPLDLAHDAFGSENHFVVVHLMEHGGQTYYGLTGHEETIEDIYRHRERCDTLVQAIRAANLPVVQFLLESMPDKYYDVNMLCDGLTPLDLAKSTFQKNHYEDNTNHPIIQYLVKSLTRYEASRIHEENDGDNKRDENEGDSRVHDDDDDGDDDDDDDGVNNDDEASEHSIIDSGSKDSKAHSDEL